MILLYYREKANRDAEFKRLRIQHPELKLRRRSASNQLFHPAHVQDQPNRESYDDGFGNPWYNTYFAHLYIIDEE